MSLPTNDSELNSIADPNPEYTYHRHSEERKMIYFRCSDKKCKARALFNKETCKFTFKSKHLDAGDHKPISMKAIPGYLISKIPTIIRGPISLRENADDPSALICNETLIFPSKREANVPGIKYGLFLKFSIDNHELAEHFSERVIEKNLAENVLILYNRK